MTLEELILNLGYLPEDKLIEHGFGKPMSWRGDYSDLAFEPKENVTIGEMLASAKSALGATFEGYKGGQYTMSEWVDVHIAEYGSLGEPINSANMRLWSM